MNGSIKCLCANCSRGCSNKTKREMALMGKLRYVYLKNGQKLTNLCTRFCAGPSEKNFARQPIFLGRDGMLKIV